MDGKCTKALTWAVATAIFSADESIGTRQPLVAVSASAACGQSRRLSRADSGSVDLRMSVRGWNGNIVSEKPSRRYLSQRQASSLRNLTEAMGGYYGGNSFRSRR